MNLLWDLQFLSADSYGRNGRALWPPRGWGFEGVGAQDQRESRVVLYGVAGW